MWRRLLLIALSLFALSSPAQTTAKGGKGAIERQRREAATALKQSNAKLESNRRATSQRLAQLASVTAEIDELDTAIARAGKEIALMDTAIACVEDTIAQLNARIADMSAKYARALQSTHRSRSGMSELAFVFASEKFGQMWRRYRNMRQFAQWRRRRAAEIGKAKENLEARKAEFDKMKSERVAATTMLENDRATLQARQRDNNRLIAELRKEQRQIRSVIADRQKEINNLDRELDRLIAQEQKPAQSEPKNTTAKQLAAPSTTRRAAADDGGASEMVTVVRTDEKGEAVTRRSAAQLGEGFRSSRGKLQWPVDGKYRVVRKFGRHKHPSLPMVETDNPGIDIGLTSGRWARAVYEGVVSAVFRQPGYNNIVMLRHGDYITVYANLETISVGKGDRVGAGQPLGVVALDEDNPGVRLLHFEIRREKTKENPEWWLK